MIKKNLIAAVCAITVLGLTGCSGSVEMDEPSDQSSSVSTPLGSGSTGSGESTKPVEVPESTGGNSESSSGGNSASGSTSENKPQASGNDTSSTNPAAPSSSTAPASSGGFSSTTTSGGIYWNWTGVVSSPEPTPSSSSSTSSAPKPASSGSTSSTSSTSGGLTWDWTGWGSSTEPTPSSSSTTSSSKPSSSSSTPKPASSSGTSSTTTSGGEYWDWGDSQWIPSSSSTTSSTKPSSSSTTTKPSSSTSTTTKPVSSSSVSSSSSKPEPTPAPHTHSVSSVLTTKEPSCETTGIRTTSCSCGYVMNTETVPALGHDYREKTIYGTKQVPKTETWYHVARYNAFHDAVPELRNKNELTGKLSGATSDTMMYVKVAEYRTPNASLTWNATRGEWIMEALTNDAFNNAILETVCRLMGWDPATTTMLDMAGLYGSWTETFELIETEVREVPGEYTLVPDNKVVNVCTRCGREK